MNNKNIKHFFKLKDKKLRYLCIHACSITNSKITNDFNKVTCKNCKRLILKELLKTPVKDRMDFEHQILIKYYGGVREYLLSMGAFKDEK
jgi:hypothetical protein